MALKRPLGECSALMESVTVIEGGAEQEVSGAPARKKNGGSCKERGDNEQVKSSPAVPGKQTAQYAKKKRPQQRRRKQYHDCLLDPANYVVKGGLRCVAPYLHTFEVFCKQRWLGRPLLDVVSAEWAMYGRNYFIRAIELGLLLVNNKPASPGYVLGQKDLLSHTVHRHEPPVSAADVEVLHRGSDGLVVVDKPATVPVHPCGSYFHNSVISILGAHHRDLRGIKTIHRLDRLTSGILLLAKNGATVKSVSNMLKSGGGVEKVYYARVPGKFPSCKSDPEFQLMKQRLTEDTEWLSLEWKSPSPSPAPVASEACHGSGPTDVDANDERYGRADIVADSASADYSSSNALPSGPTALGMALQLSCPLKCIEPAKSRHACRPDGKHAETLFSLVATNGVSSIVRCVPRTGRTHQIRLHLRKLGFPIENDPNYGPLASEAMAAGTQRAAARDLAQKTATEATRWVSTEDGMPTSASKKEPSCVVAACQAQATSLIDMSLERKAKLLCRVCHAEATQENHADDELFHEGLYLRAMEYRCPQWSFRCKLPGWADLRPRMDRSSVALPSSETAKADK